MHGMNCNELSCMDVFPFSDDSSGLSCVYCFCLWTRQLDFNNKLILAHWSWCLLLVPSIKGWNFYGQNWINCSARKMILQQQQLLTQLLFRNIELCLSNQRMPQISTSLLVSVMVTLSMTFNILAGYFFNLLSNAWKFALPTGWADANNAFLAGQMWLCGESFIHQLLTDPAFI